MARKKSRRRNQAKSKPSPTKQQAVVNVAVIEKNHADKIDSPTAESLKTIPTPTELANLKEQDKMKEAWEKVEDLWKTAEAKIMESDKLIQETEEEKDKAKETEDRAATQRKFALAEQNKYKEGLKDLYKREEEIQQEKKELEREQIDLQTSKIAVENGLPKQLKDLRTQLEEKQDLLAGKRKKWENAYEQRKEQLETQYEERKQTADQKEVDLYHEIEQREAALKKGQRVLRMEREALEEEQQLMEEKVERKAAAQITQLTAEIDKLNTIQIAKDAVIEQRNAELQQKEEEAHEFGKKSPKEILESLKTLRKENEKLKEQLADSLSTADKERLQYLENAQMDWQGERSALTSDISMLKKQAGGYLLEVGERQLLKEQLEQKNVHLKLTNAALEELKAEVEGYTEKAKAKESFEFCAAMDANKKMKEERTGLKEIDSLADFVAEMRQRIATVETAPLYYSEKTIRTFLAGLSIGKLSILQGISGTGKTSLPRAFSKAMGGGHSIVEVQSGWRDRQDLLGYYNTFESKYYESDFLKALYEANCPQYKDALYFIILDEMNLSHPEHYFADFLSLTEKDEKEQKVTIQSAAKNLPNLFQQNNKGIYLPVPPNVRFIGTANHDETTLQFAPKTYDRANIMEMPINIEQFKHTRTKQNYYSYESLSEQFSLAIKKYDGEVVKAKEFLGKIKPAFNKLGIGWGNRLENKHLAPFVSVYNAANGNTGDALDHLVATKLLRQIKGRYDLKADKLTELQNELEASFKTFKNNPEDSLSILEKEIERLA